MTSNIKRLYRSRTDRQWAGVCGGIAEFLNVDPTMVRLVIVILTLFGGTGLMFYIAAMLVVPTEPADYEKPKRGTA